MEEEAASNDPLQTRNASPPSALEAELLGPSILDALKLQLASQYASRRWRASLAKMASELKSGKLLEQVVNQLDSPRDLKHLMQAALSVPDPTQLVLEVVKHQETRRSIWREFLSLMIYPIAMLFFAIGVGICFSNFSLDLEFMEEFGLVGLDQVKAALDDHYSSLVGFALIINWTLVTLILIRFVGPKWASLSIFGGLLLFGRPLRWIALAEMLHRFRIFLEQGLPTNLAAKKTAESMLNSEQHYVAEFVHARLLEGASLGSALSRCSLNDGLCRPAIRLLDHRGAQTMEAMRVTADLIQQLADQRCRHLNNVMPIIVLLFVASIIWSIFSTYIIALRPLVVMITSLA